ncbi:hypothetical protein [Psychroflexus sp. ALD_RP9]|uniref:hypothetical protein n=1 Tax=Psychroflexus sp. ALD_RP9 TaxID=2777186 RepID=UPI001F5CF948|nr:hypothetical protein [Psychroflexus sp. ALD_RP9]
MARAMLEYSKQILAKVSFDAKLFCKELAKLTRLLQPHEIEEIRIFIQPLLRKNPELNRCLIYIN